MTLDEAIKHTEEVAYQKDLESEFETDNERYAMTDIERANCKKCAEEHRQLAEWLKELKRLKEQEPGEDWYDVPSYEMTLEQARQAVKDLRKMLASYLLQEPCKDAISRQAVKEFVEYIQTIKDKHNNEGLSINYGTICDLVIRGWKLVESEDIIKDMLPVNSQRMGHWILLGNYDDFGNESSYKCSECGDLDTYPDNFCPNCGVKMVEPQKSEEVNK